MTETVSPALWFWFYIAVAMAVTLAILGIGVYYAAHALERTEAQQHQLSEAAVRDGLRGGR